MALLACMLMATAVPVGPDVQGAGAPHIAALPVATCPGMAGGAALVDVAPPSDAAPQTAGTAAPIAAPAPAAGEVETPHDPHEHTNRRIFAFDRALDRNFLGPVAHGYSAVVPKVVRHHIGLVIANLDEPITVINNLLQLHMGRFGKSLARFVLNSTVGIGGVFDFASHHKLEHHTADFGQTLGRWGAKPGPYLMLPLLGPSNLRDGFGRAVDLVSDPVSWVFGDILTTFGASREGGEVVDGRVQADPALRAIDDSTDPYAATRSGYMQARDAAVRDATGKAEQLPDFDAP